MIDYSINNCNLGNFMSLPSVSQQPVPEPSFISFTELPDELIKHILTFLDLKSLLKFEQTCKKYSEGFTELAFCVIRLKEFNYAWKCESTNKPQKQMYKQAYVLHRYIYYYQKHVFENKSETELEKCRKLLEYYPSLETYYHRDNCLVQKQNFSDELTAKSEEFLKTQDGSPAGDYLRLLFSIQKLKESNADNDAAAKVNEYGRKAIDAKIKNVALYVLSQISNYKCVLGFFFYAAEQGNVNILTEYYVKFAQHDHFQIDFWGEAQKVKEIAPILYLLGDIAIDNNAKEEFYDKAIKAYQSNAPEELLEKLIQLKIKKSKWQEAEDLSHILQAKVEKLEVPLTAKNLTSLIQIKVKLNKWQEAMGLFCQLKTMESDDDWTDMSFLYRLSVLHYELDCFCEANKFMIKALELCIKHDRIKLLTPRELFFIAKVFSSVANFIEAEKYVSQALSFDEIKHNLKLNELTCLVKVFFSLEKFKEAEKYLVIALTNFEIETWSKELLDIASLCQIKLQKYTKAEHPLSVLISRYPKNAVPSYFLLRMVYIKYKLQKNVNPYQEMLINQILRASPDLPRNQEMSQLETQAFILENKAKLEEETYEYFRDVFFWSVEHGKMEILRKFCKSFRSHINFQIDITNAFNKGIKSGPVLYCLVPAVMDELQLKLIEKAIAIEGLDAMPQECWAIWVAHLWKKGDFKQAEGYLTKALEAVEGNVPETLYSALADTKYQLKKWDEAIVFFEKVFEFYQPEKISNIHKVQMGQCLLELKRFKEALYWFKSIDHSQITHFQANHYIAKIYFHLEDWHNFISYKTANIDSLGIDDLMKLAYAFSQVKSHTLEFQMIHRFSKKIQFPLQQELSDLQIKLYAFVAHYCVNNEFYSLAVSLFEELFKCNDKILIPADVLLEMIFRHGTRSFKSPENLIAKLLIKKLPWTDWHKLGKRCIDINNFKLAEVLYQKAIDFDDKLLFSKEFYLEVGTVKYQMDKYEEAQTYFEKGFKLHPLDKIDEDTVKNYVRNLKTLKQYEKIISFLGDLSKISKELLFELGMAYYYLGQWKQAHKILLGCHRETFEYYKTMGHIHYELQDYEKASRFFSHMQSFYREKTCPPSLKSMTLATKTSINIGDWSHAYVYLDSKWYPSDWKDKWNADTWFTFAYVNYQMGFLISALGAFVKGVKVRVYEYFYGKAVYQ